MNADPTRQEDQALLRRFAQSRDEVAFRSLVEKYTSLVFGVAMRRIGKSQAAEEVVQNVFLALAKKAATLQEQRSLGAWLHRAATLESLKSLRKDATLQRHLAMTREQQQTNRADDGDDEQLWREVRPHLDQLLDRLPTTDREIVVQHYFEGMPFAEIANSAGLSPAAAQKRSVRALKKLAGLLEKRGVAIPAAVLAGGLGTELVAAAPAGLANNVATSALAATAATTTAVTASATSLSTIITAMTTSKIAIAASFIIAASIPVGIKLGSTHAAPANKISSALPSDALDETGKPDGVAFNAETFRAELRRLASSESFSPARFRRLQRMIFTLDLDQIRTAVAVLEEFEEPEKLYQIIGTTFSRWAELDPEAAIANAVARPPGRWGYYPIHGAWDTWAFADWDAAHAWVQDAETSYDHSFLFWSYFDHMATIDGQLGVERARRLGEDFPQRADQFIERSLSSWAKNEPDKAIAWMDEELTEPVERDRLIGKALESLGEPDPKKALAHVGMIDNAERLREVRYNIFWGWALMHGAEAADFFESVDGGDQWDENTVRSAGEAIARNYPERAIEISRTIEDPKKRDQVYVGVLGGAKQSDFRLVIEAADNISAEASRTNSSLRGFLQTWEKADRDAAKAWVEALPEGSKKESAKHMFPPRRKNDL